MTGRIAEIKARSSQELLPDDYRKFRTSDIAQLRLDIKYLLEQLAEIPKWIPVSEMPEPEQRVLARVCFKSLIEPGKTHSRVIIAVYEDGKGLTQDSDFDWSDCVWGDEQYDEEKDGWYIPECWIEYSQYSEDIYKVADEVTHWMPLPAPPKGAEHDRD